MKSRWYLPVICIAVFMVILVSGLMFDSSQAAAQQNTQKIESTLLIQFETEGEVDFVVIFSEQADLSEAYSMDWDARGEYVYSTLKDAAERSQVNARAILDADGTTYQSFIAGNELYVFAAELTQANDLAALEEVDFIRAAQTYSLHPITEESMIGKISWAGDLLEYRLLATVSSSPEAIIDWGITDTKANQFWSTYGVQGNGIVVAGIDTGVQWNHPALDQAYKCGANPSNPACWFDPENWCGGSACDNNGHGTHTMGIMVGDDDQALTYTVGMAPDAKWIACKGCGTTSCSDFALNACADWILNPGGSPSNRPHIVNNSWGGSGGNPWYAAKVNAWRAAGVFPAFSAGNNYTCSSLSSPGDYQTAFSTASHTSSRMISDFSSKGPSVYGHDPFTKPNISAPGSNICSSFPGSSWNCAASGTSMASPHTAGAVALLWSCNPSLKGQVNTTFQVLQNNTDAAPAGSCGVPSDGQGNNTYGYGFLNVLKAGAMTCALPANIYLMPFVLRR